MEQIHNLVLSHAQVWDIRLVTSEPYSVVCLQLTSKMDGFFVQVTTATSAQIAKGNNPKTPSYGGLNCAHFSSLLEHCFSLLFEK